MNSSSENEGNVALTAGVEPTADEAVAEAFLQSIDEAAWGRIRWVREQLLGRKRVVVIGRGTAALVALLLREGVAVLALELEANAMSCFHALVDKEDLESPEYSIDAFSAEALKLAIENHRPDAVALVDDPGCDLAPILRMFTRGQDSPVGRVVLVVPFGHRAVDGGSPLFPRLLVDEFPSDWSVALEFQQGHLKLVAKGLGLPQRPDVSHLLELTEAGASEGMQAERFQRLAVQRELNDTREALQDAERVAEELRTSTSFRIGLALIMALRSPRELLMLPLTVVRVVRERRQRRSQQASAPTARTGLTEWDKERLRSRARQMIDGGVEAVVAAAEEAVPEAPDSLKAFAYLVAAQACGADGYHDLEFEIATRALELNRSVGMLRGYLHVALRCRKMQAASDTLRELHEAERVGNAIAKQFLRNFRQTSSYKIAVLEAIPPRQDSMPAVDGGRFVYVLHNSLPYSSGGYATRSHGVAVALAERRHPVVCLTRPGYPLDINKSLAPVDVPMVDLIDGVPYQRVGEPSRLDVPEFKYVLAAAERMEQEIRRLSPAYIQAASNYVTALPALVAARRLGVPFFYEVRGLWEITRMSRDQQFADSISFDVQRHIEATVAREADHVFTLTQPMLEELVDRGVDPERITLLPNSVDAARFRPLERDDALAKRLGIPAGVPVIGYIGTFVIYEGLEHLAEACVQLHKEGHDFRLLLVGNENASGQERGPITEDILRIAREGGIESKLILAGRIPHEEVEAHYSLIDICPFPRKPWPVCEMVSPMKPLEALAMRKAVVVSSVRALVEMISDNVTGLVFEKGNVAALATAIAELISNPSKRAMLGAAGRDWVVQERAWSQVADRIEGVLGSLDAGATRPGNPGAAGDPAQDPL